MKLKRLSALLLAVVLTIGLCACGMTKEGKYDKAVADVKAGRYDEAIETFESLNGYEDSDKYIMYARCLKAGDSGNYETAINSLTSMGDFKEAGMYIKYYTALSYEAAQEYEEAAKIYNGILLFKDVESRNAALPDKILDRDLAEAERKAEEEDSWYALSEMVGKRYTTSETQMYENIMAFAAQLHEKQEYEKAGGAYLLVKEDGYEKADAGFKESAYQLACVRMADEEYTDAGYIINEYLLGYKDADELSKECIYQLALEMEASGAQSTQAAYDAFKALETYKDSAEYAAAFETKYAEAVSKRETSEFDAAIALFVELGTYSDSKARLDETQEAKAYAAAVSLINNEKYEEAIEAFRALNGYSDSAAQIEACEGAILEREYQKAVSLRSDEKYEEAIEAFKALNGYSDSAAQIEACEATIFEREYQKAVSLMKEEKYEEAIEAFCALNGYSDSAAQIEACEGAILEREYQKAVSLMKEEKYEEAIEAFKALNGYSDSAAQIEACEAAIIEHEYQKAVSLRSDEKYEEAIEAFCALNGYSDSAAQIEACEAAIVEREYQKAETLRENGQYAEAYAIYLTIRGYKDVNEIMANDAGIAAARRAEYQPGSYVTFGAYPQTKSGTDNTPIEWLVLESDGETALLISRYALDSQPYNTVRKNITWEQCTLRSWLNNEFYNRAFSDEEKQSILKSDVSADRNPSYSTNPGNATKDNVFLLSIVEAKKYFASDEARMCASTDYAIQQGAYADSYNTVDGRGACWWWLRSLGYDSLYAAYVDYGGSVDSIGNRVDYSSNAVRPCVRVRLF